MGWISRLFSPSKTTSKKQYNGWAKVRRVLVLFDSHEDAVHALVQKWTSEGKEVKMIHWKTPAPKKDLREKFFTEKDIRFGKITNPEFEALWNDGVLFDLTTTTHKRLVRLLENSTFDFIAGINEEHKSHYDLFTPYTKGKFEPCLQTVETYIKIINSNTNTVSL